MALGASSSKAEEKAVLDKWVKEAGEQTYLSSFLSKGLVDWLKVTIDEDGNCDIWAYLRDAQKELQKQIAHAYEVEVKLRDATAVAEERRVWIAKLEENALADRETRQEIERECRGERDRVYKDFRYEQLEKLSALHKLEELEAQAQRLKARLLDALDEAADLKAQLLEAQDKQQNLLADLKKAEKIVDAAQASGLF